MERDLLITEKVLQLVRKLKAQQWVEYISFSYDICTYIIKNELNAKVAYLNGDVEPEKMKKDGFTGVDYHFSVYQKNRDYIERFKKLGLSINGWTANTPEAIKFLFSNQVDYITTNEPELVFDLAKQIEVKK